MSLQAKKVREFEQKACEKEANTCKARCMQKIKVG